MATIDELSRMKKKIDDAKTEEAKLGGQLADRMARLKELGFNTTEVADAELDRLHEQIASLDEQVQRGVAELHETYGL